MSPGKRVVDEFPSPAASLDDFSENESPTLQASPAFRMPSQHSGFRSSSILEDDQSVRESSIEGSTSPWSPPAWQRPGSGWFNQEARLAPSAIVRQLGSGSVPGSREQSPLDRKSRALSVEGDPLLQAATRVPLPVSPEKQRSPSPSPVPGAQEEVQQEEEEEPITPPNNYIRFSVRADVQHRTDPLEAVILYWKRITKTWSSTLYYFTSLIVILCSINYLTRTPENRPGPDLIKAAGLARSFEPMLEYSEAGMKQVSQLQDTGIAVWDLGESVRLSNMNSAPIMVNELDELSTTLKSLADELTKFFASINGNVDGIILVMEWASRELQHVTSAKPSTASTFIDNLSTLAVDTTSGKIPPFSPHVHQLLGLRNSHHAQRVALSRTFNEFIGVLDEAIGNELTYAQQLKAMFEAIDRQFGNLQASIVREIDTQDALTDAELATLWSKLFGPSTSTSQRLRKFQRNKELLSQLRARTGMNKKTLQEHEGRLIGLRTNLDQLKKRLTTPLIRAENSSTAGLREQIEGLDGTREYLVSVRSSQKGRLSQAWFSTDGEAGRRWLGSA